MLFLILVSETTITVFGSDDVLKISSLSLLQWAILLLLEWWSALWKEKQLEKISIKDKKIPLR